MNKPSMHCSTSESPPPAWGSYAPHGLNRLLLLLIKAGLSHGRMKGIMGRYWRGRLQNEPVDLCRYGIRFRLHPWDNNVEYKLLFGSGTRDREEMHAIGQAVTCGGTFLDIGANVGFYSLMAAKLGASSVIAIEPNPTMCSRLIFNIQANIGSNNSQDHITVVAVALGDREDEVELALAGDLGSSRIDVADNAANHSTIRVPMKPLHKVVKDAKIDRIDAMKIDVEGMEDAVLMPFFESTPSTLWPKVIVLEYIWNSRWKQDVLGWMLSHGYQETSRTRSNVLIELNRQEKP